MQRLCREQFSVTVGTVFERSKIGLHKWVLAAHLMAASKKGMSSKQLQRMLGVTYKTAWFMTMRLREAMNDAKAGPIGGEGKIVESDETFVGGKKKNVHKGKPEPKKHAVHALVERRRRGARQARCRRDRPRRCARICHAGQPQVRPAHRRRLRPTIASARSSPATRPSTTPRTNTSRTAPARRSAESFFAILKRGVTAPSTASASSTCSATWTSSRSAGTTARRWASKISSAPTSLLKGAAGKRLTYRPTDKAQDA